MESALQPFRKSAGQELIRERSAKATYSSVEDEIDERKKGLDSTLQIRLSRVLSISKRYPAALRG